MRIHVWDHLDPSSEAGRRWEALVQANRASGVMQSLPWAAFKRAQGQRTFHLGLEHDGQLIGGGIAYAAADAHHANLITLPEGPVLPWHDPAIAREGLKLLRDGFLDVVPDAIGIRIEPLVAGARPALLRDWGRAPVNQLALDSLWLDIQPEPAAILAQMRPKGRYNIKIAQRHGVTVRETIDPDEIQSFYELMHEAAIRDEFYIEHVTHFSDLLEYLAPKGHARLLFADYDGDVLGTMLLITYGQRGVYLYGGISSRQRNVMAGYALQWAAIMCARRAGCTVYDFYGYEATGDPNHQYARFSRFKRSFGGTPISFIGAHDFYWPDRVADAVVRAVHELNKEV